MSTIKKPRADAKLKTLPEQDQVQLMAWLRANTQERVIALVREKWKIETSAGALSEFWRWWHLSRRLQEAKSFADQLKQDLAQLPGLNLSDDQLSQAAQRVFEIKALKEDDGKLFYLLRQNSLGQQRLQAERAKTDLARQRFEVQTCELFLKWFKDARSREIAQSSAPNAEKIAALRKAHFSDVDELEKSGRVVLPK